MGVRNLTLVLIDNEFKVAQYGQWDGYPKGNGLDICNFIHDSLETPEKLEKFKTIVRSLSFYSKKELEEIGAEEKIALKDQETYKEFCNKYAVFNRDIGARILEDILDTNISKLQSFLSFASESLFCEWAYLLDLDRDVLEIYKGFNQHPTKNQRFSDFPQPSTLSGSYYPISFLMEIPFSDIIVNYDLEALMTQVEKKAYPDDEEDEEEDEA